MSGKAKPARKRAPAQDLQARMWQRTYQLKDARVYLSAIYENSHDGIGVVDAEGRFEHGNPAAFRIVGWQPRDLIGEHFLKIFPPEWHPFLMERWEEVQRGEGTPYESEVITKKGERRQLLISHRHMTIGGQRKYVVIVTDITRQKQEQEQLRHYGKRLEEMVAARTSALTEANKRLSTSEEALERAQAIARIGNFEAHSKRGHIYWSREMFRLYKTDPARGIPSIAYFDAVCHPDDVARVKQAVARTMRKGDPLHVAYRLRFPDGTTRHLLARGVLRKAEGSGHVISGTLQDISEQRRLEQEIVRASQQEQRRLGEIMHDSLGQELAALALLSSNLERHLKKAGHNQAQQAGALAALARECVAQTRALASDLTPIDIQFGGLSDELRQMIEQTGALYAHDIRLQSRGSEPVHNRDVATHLFYIAREAVTNACRHAKAKQIRVTLSVGREQGRLSIRDDGRWPATAKEGIGLRIMRHRADIIGARLSIERGLSTGTRVTCVFPNPVPGAVDA